MTFTSAQWLGLAPMLLVSGGIALVMLQAIMHRGPRPAFWIVVLALAGAMLASSLVPEPVAITDLFLFDAYACTLTMLFCGAGLAGALLLFADEAPDSGDETAILLLLAVLGSISLAGARHAAMLLLGLEILTVALYGLIAWPARSPARIEAATKYLVLSAVSSATLLFGLAVLYLVGGSVSFETLPQLLADGVVAQDRHLAALGTALMWAGLGFKLSLVPFHLWTADVYQGAPPPIAGLLATLSKGAVAAVLLRFTMAHPLPEALATVLGWIAATSIILGSGAALLTINVKRLLAYSSIANAGYLLVPFVVGGPLSNESVLFFLFTYFPASLAAFGVLSKLAKEGDEDLGIAHLRGLWQRRPGLALCLGLSFLSLAGIPLTAGFVGKFYVIAVGVEASNWGLVAAVVIGSALALYYYLRPIVVMLLAPDDAAPSDMSESSLGDSALLAGLCALLLWWGLMPAPLMERLGTAAQSLHRSNAAVGPSAAFPGDLSIPLLANPTGD